MFGSIFGGGYFGEIWRLLTGLPVPSTVDGVPDFRVLVPVDAYVVQIPSDDVVVRIPRDIGSVQV